MATRDKQVGVMYAKHVRRAADGGCAAAQTELGALHLHMRGGEASEGVERDDVKAVGAGCLLLATS